MQFDRDHLAALAAVLRAGSFDGAAAELGITQPAISLRIKALEERVGLPLVRRGAPCSATPAGARLARHAEEIALMEQATLADLALDPGVVKVTLAVNADSLATWFAPVLPAAAGMMLDVQIDDQDHSADWLARGAVSAAITGTARAAAGCDVHPLGALRYVATAAPGFVRRWFADGVTPESLARAPSFAFNAKDQLQARWMQHKTGRKLHPPTHFLPSTHAFIDGARTGAAWGMNPLCLIEQDLAAGRLVALDADLPLDVPLFWQVRRRVGAALGPLTTSVKRAARAGLRAPS